MDERKKCVHDHIVLTLRFIQRHGKIESWRTNTAPFKKGKEAAPLMYSVYPMKEWLDGHFLVMNILFVDQDVDLFISKSKNQAFHIDLVVGQNFALEDFKNCLKRFFVDEVERLMRDKKFIESYNDFAQKNKIPIKLKISKTKNDIQYATDAEIVFSCDKSGKKVRMKVPLQLKTDEKGFDFHRSKNKKVPSILFDHKQTNFKYVWRALKKICIEYQRGVSEHLDLKNLSSALKQTLDNVKLHDIKKAA